MIPSSLALTYVAHCRAATWATQQYTYKHLDVYLLCGWENGGESPLGMEPVLLCAKNKNTNMRRKARSMQKEEKERERANGGEEVVEQYNIRQPLEHNNTERDKY